MTLSVRIYKTEKGATAADMALASAGFENRNVFLARELKGNERASVQAAIDKGSLPENNLMICTRALEEGQSLVSVDAPFGTGHDAITIMDSISGAQGDLIGRYVPDNPAPFSSSLGLPVLSRSAPATSLVSSHWSLSSVFGIGLLSNKAAPFSSMFGMKTLTTRKREKTSSFGLPLLSRNPAPLSSVFAMATILKRKREWNWSFGMPLLSKNPAPLSKLFGLPILSKDK